jgi:hypothetical protein
LTTILFFTAGSKCYSQKSNFEYLFNKDKSERTISDLKFYVGLSHQHQDIFNKAFSFQGVEAGLVINHKLLLAIYGSTFVSNLDVEVHDNPMYLMMNQAGFIGGLVNNDSKLLHTGFLLSVGYFSLSADKLKLPMFSSDNHEIGINGLVLAPQVFAELNVLKWMKFRAGLAYNFYSFENQEMIAKTKLENISINFGFLFGKFRKV